MAAPADRPPPQAAPLRPGWILALVCLPIFIGALDLTIVSAVLPAVLADLRIPYQSGLDDASWVVSAYLLAYTVSMTFMGRVSDLWGRRRVYVICLAIFIVGSVLVAIAPGAPADAAYALGRALTGSRPDRAFMALYALIFGRVVQAFGAGALVPISMALMGDLYPAGRRAVPLGVIGGVDTAGWVLGHLYGGIMVQYLSWPWLFWLNVPLAGLALALTAWALRDLPEHRAGGRLDWAGAGLITASLASLNLGLNTGVEASPGPAAGTSASFSTPLLLVAAAFLGAFLLVERSSASPLLNLRSFRDRNFSAASAANLLVGFCIMVGLVSVPLYMNTVPTILYGLQIDRAALLAGYLLSALTVPMALAAVLGGWLTNRLGLRGMTAIGAALAAAGFWMMSRWGIDESGPAVELLAAGWAAMASRLDLLVGTGRLASGLVVAGVGLGFTISPIATAVINAAASAERGVASALVIIMRLVGMTLSISIMTNYGLGRSRALLVRGMVGIGLTDFAAQAQVLVQTTTQVIGEMALVAAGVSLAALLVALLLRDESAQPAAVR